MADFDFGLNTITEALSKQDTLRQNRQAAQVQQQHVDNAAAKNIAEITSRSAKVSQKLISDIEPLFAQTNEIMAGKAEQDALKSSGDPLDFLSYVGNQIIDPSKYTSKGRTKAIAETTQMINMKTQQAGLAQAAMSDLINVVKADAIAAGGQLNLSTLLEQQNTEVIQAEMFRVQAQAQTLANHNVLIDQKLAMLSSDQIREVAAKAGGQPIDVGGVMISPGALESRMDDLDNRALLQEQRTLAREAKQFELDKKLARKELETMSLEEIRPLLQTGSDRFDLDDIQSVYNVKKAAESDSLVRLGQEFQYSDIGANVIVPAIEDVERIKTQVPPNSPLAHAVKYHESNIGGIIQTLKQVAELNGGVVSPEIRAASAIAIQKGREELDSAISKEAKLKAKGDKDLEDAYTELYRGNPVPRASVELAVFKRLSEGMPMTDIFPPETAKEVQRAYTTHLQKLNQQNAMGQMMPGAPTMTLKERQQEASRVAIAEGIARTTTERTQDLFGYQTQMPGHPLSGKLDGNQMLGAIAQADQAGIKKFQATYQLTDEEMSRFMAGEAIEGKVTAADAANLGIIQSQELMMKLDSYEPGLGKQYAEWWVKNGNSYMRDRQQQRASQGGPAGLPESAIETFAAPMELEQTAAYIQVVSQAYEGYDNAKQERFNNLVSFDYKPENRQAALLQFDDSLTDSERSTFMRNFLLPLIEKGREGNLSYEEINKQIEIAIDSNIAPDAETAKILKKVAKNRVGIVDKVESIMVNPFWKFGRRAVLGGAQLNEYLGAGDQNPFKETGATGFRWYRDAMEGR